MKWGTSARVAAALIVATGCRAGFEADEPEAIARVSPATLSAVGGWGLFDRSVESGFVPSGEPIRAALDHPAQIAAVKVHGSAPYRLRIAGRDGSSLGFAATDLSRLGPGWHVLPSSTIASTDLIELRFEPLGAPGKVAEVELWAVDTETSPSRADVTADEQPPRP
jgi:hypothetical protein